MATLRDERNHDMLTGVLNRRGFWEFADPLARDRKAQPLSIVVADLDHFKRVNDNWGTSMATEYSRPSRKSYRQVSVVPTWWLALEAKNLCCC